MSAGSFILTDNMAAAVRRWMAVGEQPMRSARSSALQPLMGVGRVSEAQITARCRSISSVVILVDVVVGGMGCVFFNHG